MAYSTKPHIPKVRMEAVRLVEAGWSVREVARHLGYTHSAVVKWVARSRMPPHNLRGIPTQFSRPRSHAHALPPTVVTRLLHIRQERNECAEIIQHRLGQEGIIISLSSVKRVLRRYRTSRYSRWKTWHQYPPVHCLQSPVFSSKAILSMTDRMITGCIATPCLMCAPDGHTPSQRNGLLRIQVSSL
jgi:transposase